jgi:hypothetical protein
MVELPSRSFPSLRWVTVVAVATGFLTIANSTLAQERFRTPDEAVAALTLAAGVDQTPAG